MKYLLFLFCAILLNSCTSKAPQDNDWKKQHLNGKVKNIFEESFELLPDVNEYGHLSIGNKTYESGYDSYIEFNKNGFLTQKKLMNVDGTTANIYIYEYNRRLLTKTTRHTATENIDKVFVYTYDKNNLQESCITYTALGNIDTEEKYFYTNGLLTSQKLYMPGGDFIYEWNYTYDDKGNRISGEWLVNDTHIQILYSYNELNQLIEQTELNQTQTKWEYKYDDQGNVVSEITSYEDNSQIITEYEYEYDEFNNWVVKLTYKNGAPRFITERTIEYY